MVCQLVIGQIFQRVIESKNNFINAKEKYRNQLTIPLHQDIESNQIINCIKKLFKIYQVI